MLLGRRCFLRCRRPCLRSVISRLREGDVCPVPASWEPARGLMCPATTIFQVIKHRRLCLSAPSERVLKVCLPAAQFRRARLREQRHRAPGGGGGGVTWGIVPPWGALCGRLRSAGDPRPHAAPALLPGRGAPPPPRHRSRHHGAAPPLLRRTFFQPRAHAPTGPGGCGCAPQCSSRPKCIFCVALGCRCASQRTGDIHLGEIFTSTYQHA